MRATPVPSTILFLCRHNAGRSQLAAAAALHPTWRVLSAGLAVGKRSGEPPPESVRAAAARAGYPLPTGAARTPVTPEMARDCDIIVVIAPEEELPDYLSRHPHVVRWDVPDPRGLPADVLDAAAAEIVALVAVLALGDTRNNELELFSGSRSRPAITRSS